MNRILFYNSAVFRLVAPTLFGLLAYLLVLMFFDTVGMLAENFFSREAIFVIGISYLFFEANRLVIILYNRFLPAEKNLRIRLIVQFLTGLIISVIVVTCVLYFYFIRFEGFSTIITELITFNSIFTLFSLFYHLHFFSLVFLFRKNEKLIQHHAVKKMELELEMEAFRNKVNPDFLFESLDILISEFHQNKKHADELVNKLAQIYRYTLDNSQNELVAIQEELNILESVIAIFETKCPGMLITELKLPHENSIYVIPGILQRLYEGAFMQSIITPALPFQFRIFVDPEFIMVSYSNHPKISLIENDYDPLWQVKKAYAYYSDKIIEKVEKKGEIHICIPVLSIEEE